MIIKGWHLTVSTLALLQGQRSEFRSEFKAMKSPSANLLKSAEGHHKRLVFGDEI